MKTYFHAIGLLLFILFSLSVALPFLISAASNELFLLGVVYMVLAVPLVFVWAKKIVSLIGEMIDEENNSNSA